MKNSRRNLIENSIQSIAQVTGKSRNSKRTIVRDFRYRITQFFCILLLSSILANSAPAAPRVIVVSAGEIGQDIRFGYMASPFIASLTDWTSTFLLFFTKTRDTKPQQVARIQILPGDVTVVQSETVNFSAIAYTSEGDTVGGQKFFWKADYLDRTVKIPPMPNGRFTTKLPGNYLITVKTDSGQQAQAKVTIVANEALLIMKKLQDERAKGDLTNINKLKQEGKLTEEEVSSRKEYKPTERQAGVLDGLIGWMTGEEGPHGPNPGDAENESSTTTPATTMIFRPADEDGWNNSNYLVADDPVNQIGNPPGTAPDNGAGNGNFQFSAPVVSLPGRGINLNLALNYNSRLWSKVGTQMVYDADKGYPAPGWSLGFGKIVFMGTSGGCMIEDPDGTRHSYDGPIYNYGGFGSTTSSTYMAGRTTDSTLIDYNCYYTTNVFTGVKNFSGIAQLPNGTTISYNSSTTNGEQAFPTRITDRQGNYIDITYRSNHGPDIDTITDTLGRVVIFNYDSNNRLISVTVPQYNGGTRTAVRLHYAQITLNPGFASGTTTEMVK